MSLARSPILGMRVIKPLLMEAEVAPELSIAAKAWSKVGATSSTYSWKNSIGTPSCPGAFPLGNALMASRMSFTVRSLVKLALVSWVTFIGMLLQHSA